MQIQTVAPLPAVVTAQAPVATTKAPRFWFPIALVLLLWTFLLVLGQMELTTFVRFLSRLGANVLLSLVFVVWWWVNRRIPLLDRVGGFLLAVGLGVVASLLAHVSIAGFGLLMLAPGVVLGLWTLWMVCAKSLSAPVRRWGFLVAMVLAWGPFTLLRSDGLSGEQEVAFRWRWTKSAEELFLAQRAQSNERPISGPAKTYLTDGDWPGFRGPNRDGKVQGIRIATDWKTNPPRLVWRRRVGPAWSSVVVVGGLLFTQEQRGQQEAVVCCDALTGKEIWSHEDEGRYYDAVAEAGPRATPTFAEGRICALGAFGKLNCLDAATGRRYWSRDITADAGVKVQQWGFSSSPLVTEGLVVVFAGGESPKGLLAYSLETGDPAWTVETGRSSYSSPQLVTLGGKKQIVFLSDKGLTAVEPASGKLLWEQGPAAAGSVRAVQPQALDDSRLLIASETDLGLALVEVTSTANNWTASQQWASKDLKPSFNDFVVHRGHVFGFDGRIFACASAADGKRRWKEGRYGHGQVLLLEEQSLLLVITEKGAAILLKADPERHQQLGRFQAIEGKTWNHPVIAHGKLYVRNAEEIACYELAEE